jgi:hypothetical protein
VAYRIQCRYRPNIAKTNRLPTTTNEMVRVKRSA